MKSWLPAFITAALIAGGVVSPVGAAPFASSVPCGNSYIVQNKDTLLKIAELCGTTVDNILALNPQIGNSNLIYIGQELRVKGKAYPVIRVMRKTTFPTTYTVQEGDTFLKIATLYDITIWEIIQANPGFTFFTRLVAGMKIAIPASTRVTSYTLQDPANEVYRNPRVAVSTTLAEPGDDIHVLVSGFPPGAWIDYQIGITGQSYAFLYDGTISDDGTASLTFEIPTSAKDNDLWIVFVATTSQKVGVQAYSPVIRIHVPGADD